MRWKLSTMFLVICCLVPASASPAPPAEDAELNEVREVYEVTRRSLEPGRIDDHNRPAAPPRGAMEAPILRSQTVGNDWLPTIALEVDGAVRTNGALFGYGDLPILQADPGAGNTALGVRALANVDPEFGMFLYYGLSNTAVGDGALYNLVDGYYNVAVGAGAAWSTETAISLAAVGFDALESNTTGGRNTGVGSKVLESNEEGWGNTAVGSYALQSNEGESNTAIGGLALWNSTTGEGNVALGYGALMGTTRGDWNVAIGSFAGINNVEGDFNVFIDNPGAEADGTMLTNQAIRIGTDQDRTFIAGIAGTALAGPLHAVYIDSSGQLGQSSSSRRFKKEIVDMGSTTERLEELRPVTFRYSEDDERLRYGLIAEEVAKIYPELVTFDGSGRPTSVLYHQLAPMLLNELLRQRAASEELLGELEQLRLEVAALRSAASR